MSKASGRLNRLLERSQDYLFHAWTVLVLLALMSGVLGLPLYFTAVLATSVLIVLSCGALIACVQLSFTAVSLLINRYSLHMSWMAAFRSTAVGEDYYSTKNTDQPSADRAVWADRK